jgi:hypothetical protein
LSYYVQVGEGRDSWSFPNPCSDRVVAAERAARFGFDGLTPLPTHADVLILASVTEAFRYLLSTAPSDKAAVDKLRAMRRALRTPPQPKDTRGGGT